MAVVTVRAIAAFAHHGRRYRPGESVVMSAVDAAIHARKQHVSLTRVYPTREMKAEPPTPEPEPEAKPQGRRRYRRRDMVAEP